MPNLVRWIESLITTASRFAVSRDLPDYCDLQTVVRLTDDDRVRHPQLTAPYIMVTDDGDYCTVYAIAGSFCDTDERAAVEAPYSWAGRLLRMTQHLTASYRRHGHKVSLVFDCDPTRGAEEVAALLAPHYRSIRRTGIDLKAILDENHAKLSPWVSRERAYVVCYTGRQSLSTHELVDEHKRLKTLIEQSPAARFGQNPVLADMTGLKIRHNSFLTVVAGALRDNGEGVLLDLMDVHAAGHALREQVDREGTAPGWQPLLPDDPITPHGIRQAGDHTPFLAPWLNFQLMNQDVETRGNKLCINGLWHGSLSVELGPQAPQSFAKLKALVPREVPWRVRMDLMPGGLAALRTKKGLLDFMAFVPALRPVWSSIETLTYVEQHEPVCVMTIMASTWGHTPEEVTRNLTLLKQAFEAWGICAVTLTFGDPVRAWAATLVASSKGSGLHPLYPPLSQALHLLPLTRPASAWAEDGNALFPTPDGKLYPVGLATHKQNKLTNVIVGSPGLGKSVLLNKLGNVQISSAQQQLPFFAGVDKGFSMQGQVALLRDALPEARKDEVIGIVLQNDAKHCRNLFDIQLGAQYPINPERHWIQNMLTGLCIDPSTGAPPNERDTAQIFERVITMAYEKNAETEPRKWVHGLQPDIDRALLASGVMERHSPEWWSTATWYEVRDLLFEAGYVSQAQQAQFQAVPELADMTSFLNHENIKMAFGNVQRDGSQERLLEYLRRCMVDACAQYKMFAGRTQFVISPKTRVIAIDLNNVMGDDSPSGHLKTGLMYLFAGEVAGGHFVLPQYRDPLMQAVSPLYHALHNERLQQLDQEVKNKVYDELHNAEKANFIFPMLETQDREQRKFGIRTVLSSQYVRDFPEAILKSANSLFMMEVDPDDENLLIEHFKVPKVTIRHFQRMGSGPAQDGSGVPFLGVFRIKGGSSGSTLARILKNAMGPLELWALNSSPIDSPLRRILYEEVGGVTARAILAEAFPQGTAENLIALRQRQAQEVDAGNVTQTLARELIAKRGYNL